MPMCKQVFLHARTCVCVHVRVCVRACSVTQSCLTLWEQTDCSLPGSSVHGIFQARILEGNLPDPGIKSTSLVSPALAGRFFTTGLSGKRIGK